MVNPRKSYGTKKLHNKKGYINFKYKKWETKFTLGVCVHNSISSTLVRDQIQKDLLSISVWGKGGAFSNSSMVFGSCILIGYTN